MSQGTGEKLCTGKKNSKIVKSSRKDFSQVFCLVISNTHYIIKGVLKDFRRFILVPPKT